MEEKIRVMPPQAKGTEGCQEPPEAAEAKMDSPMILQRECGSGDTLILKFWPPELWEN